MRGWDLQITSKYPLYLSYQWDIKVQLYIHLSVIYSDWFVFLVYEGEDHTYKFQAPSEDERDEWIQVIHTASYECLKMQLQSLREQIQAKTGRDPITQPPPTEFGMEYETQSQGM